MNGVSEAILRRRLPIENVRSAGSIGQSTALRPSGSKVPSRKVLLPYPWAGLVSWKCARVGKNVKSGGSGWMDGFCRSRPFPWFRRGCADALLLALLITLSPC